MPGKQNQKNQNTNIQSQITIPVSNETVMILKYASEK